MRIIEITVKPQDNLFVALHLNGAGVGTSPNEALGHCIHQMVLAGDFETPMLLRVNMQTERATPRFQIERMDGVLIATDLTADSPQIVDMAILPGYKFVENLQLRHATMAEDTPGGETFYIRRTD